MSEKIAKREESNSAERFFRLTREYLGKADQRKVRKAYSFALEAHHGQSRKSGEAYIEHPLAVATFLAEAKLDSDTLCAALLHDVVEDTSLTLEDLRGEFGEEIAQIIDGVTKLERFRFGSVEEEQAENIRKMLIAVAKDIRVILIKLADRLHNMQTISALPEEKRRRIAEETVEIYAPLAHRFGISQLKGKLEDLSFEVLHPERYQQIKRMVRDGREEREGYVESAIGELSSYLRENRLKAEISGRVKNFYSIYEKMLNRGIDFDEIMDLVAVRVIVDTVRDCYAALGLVHSLWKPVPERFKDYIAMPKFNMYCSLHTVVIGPEGRPLEIQIRTKEMHQTAEYGIAAHWLYKESSRSELSWKAWLKQVMEWQSELKDPKEFMKTLKIDLFQDEVFVFTPKGELKSLPKGATPLDFAYSIHTDVGHRCIGARVGGKMVPLTYQLQTGDTVEILTSKSGGPSRDWVNIVVTSRARNKIRQWFSQERREEEVSAGKEALEGALEKAGVKLGGKRLFSVLQHVAADHNCEEVEDFLRLIGAKHYSASRVAAEIKDYLGEEVSPEGEAAPEVPKPADRERLTQRIRVEGIDNALVTLAGCCNPSRGDPLVGFITRGRGVSVHKKNCPNISGLSPERVIDVSWERGGAEPMVVEVCVRAVDRPKLVRDITTVLGDHQVNIISASFSLGARNAATSTFTFEVASKAHLGEIMRELRKVDSVLEVTEAKEERLSI